MKTRKPCRVLVWARDPALEAPILRALQKSPYLAFRVERVGGRREALASLAGRRADVVLLALSSGEGLARLRAARAGAPDTPVVVLVPPGGGSLGLKALEAGAAGVLARPRIDPARLVLSIGVALRAGARERELRSARDQAEQATLTKSEFLASMSHEIRTPIHAILGSTELLMETLLDDEQREYAGTVQSSASILLGLVNDVLDFSRIEAGKLSLESIDFDLAAVVEGAVELSALEAHHKGLELATRLPSELPGTLRGDPARLRQVLVNLVNNAVKFTHAGEVVVSVQLLASGGSEAVLEFSVRDTGIGIPADKRARLFQTFSQLDSATARKYGGTGLGLAISRSLVEMMGGRMGVESREGEGSRFWFTLPANAPRPVDRSAAVPPDFFAGLRVLIVDDNGSVRQILREHLSFWGCVVGEAASGAQALALLRAGAGGPQPWNLALVDLRLPGMDGWRLASEINADKAINGTRLILLSPLGLSAEEAKMKLLRWFNGYITKPVRRQKLVETVFTVTAADLDLEALPVRGPEREPFPGGEWRILVVDDSEVSRELFRAVLEKAGYSVDTAADGVEALEKSSRAAYDVVFMDLNMPGTSGLDAARRMRDRGIAATIVAVTASARADEQERCLASGMNDFLPKPFRRHDLARLLAKWLPDGGNAAGAAAAPETGAAGPEPAELQAAEAEEPTPAARGSVVFDRDAAVATFLGRGELVDRLLRGLLQRAESGLQTIHGAVARGDAETIRSEAHAIKGAALNLSANGLAEASRALERCAMERRMDAVAVFLSSLEAALGELKASLPARPEEGEA